MSRICIACHKTRANSLFRDAIKVCNKCERTANTAGSVYRERKEKFLSGTRKRRADQNRRSFPADRYHVIKKLKERPAGMHSDHVVPLNGWTHEGHPVSGLHVSWNIQYLTPEDNDAKGNGMRPCDDVIWKSARAYT